MDHLPTTYWAAKSYLGGVLGASEDLLHVHAGLLIFFAAALLFRRRMRSRIPVGLVWAFALGNELIDAFTPRSDVYALEPTVDILNTVFWPTLLFLLARRRAKAENPSQAA